MLGLTFVWIVCIVSLIFAGWLVKNLLKKDSGTPKMQEIANAIRLGANAFLKRQYTTISILSIFLSLLILGIYSYFGKQSEGVITSVSFIFGAFCSAVSGFVGMWTAVRANVRTAASAKQSLNNALQTSFRAGAIPAIVIVSLSLLGISLLYFVMSNLGYDIKDIPFLIVGYGFGASFVALFAQLGGGIYTKAADVGADLVGKVEAGIPEDDPRNPAVIADLVGDNVGDCAGRGADLFESISAENISAMIIGVALFAVFGINGILFPLVMGAVGLIASIIGILTVKCKENENPIIAMSRGFIITAIITLIGLYFVTTKLLDNLWFFYAGIIGIVTSMLFLLITIYYTESSFRPVKSIANASKTGHATNIIAGLSVGLECTALPVLVLSFALFLSYKFGILSGVANGGIYGIAVATIGMLATAVYVLAMDNFGPISDNAGGIVEMSKAPENIRKVTDKLDATGNTTKALTKGYAIGSAALAAFLLFSAYTDELAKLGKVLVSVDITKIPVFIGGFIGAMLIFLFSSFVIRAVSEAAGSIVEEVRRQFKEIKGIMSGKSKPDYAKCVDICAKAALKKMILPGLLVLVFTLAVGFLLKAEALAAYLMVGTITGILMALLLNTAGGAWDNAKKFIETGALGGKGSDAHKAAVTGDTVGDPAKDAAGPSLHVLIKLLGTLTLVLAPLFI